MPKARDPHEPVVNRAQPASSRFTNRIAECALFTRLLRAPLDTPLPLLMFYGVAGAGKTAVLEHLQRECAAARVPAAAIDLAETPGAVDALSKLAARLETEHGLKFAGFKRAVAVLAARQSGEKHAPVEGLTSAGASQCADLILDGLGLVPVVGQLAAMVKLGKGSFQLAMGKALDHAGFRGAMLKLGGQEDLLHLMDWPLPDLLPELERRFAADFCASVPERSGCEARAVLFLDTHEALWQDSSGGAYARDEWIRTLREHVHGRGVLLVMAGRDLLAWDEDWREVDRSGRRVWLDEHVVGGLGEADARELIGKLATEAPVPEELVEAVLRVSNERSAHVDSAHHCYLLTLCMEVLGQTHRGTGAYPCASEFEGIRPGAGAGEKLAARFLASLHNQAMVGWLKDLSLAPRFNEEFALELDRARHHHNGRAGWSSLRRLTLLEERQTGYVEIHRVLREALRARVSAEDARQVHQWAYRFWTERAEQRLKEEGWYSFEASSWHEAMQFSLFHLCRAGTAPADTRPALVFTELVLDVFWWWSENLPSRFWDQIFRTVEQALQPLIERAQGEPLPEQVQELIEAMALLRRFDEAWPKGWVKDPAGWDAAVRTKWGAAVVERWSWPETIRTLRDLRELLNLEPTEERILRPQPGTVPPVPGSAAAMLSNFLGLALIHQADDLATAPDAAPELRNDARRHFQVMERWFAELEPDRLASAWAHFNHATLHLSEEAYDAALRSASESISLIGRERATEGCSMETVAEAYRISSAAYWAQGQALAAGDAMGRALVYCFGFHATDHDEYTEAYYADLCAEVERHLASLSGEDDRLYLEGLRRQWQDDPAPPVGAPVGGDPNPLALVCVIRQLPSDAPDAEVRRARRWARERIAAFIPTEPE